MERRRLLGIGLALLSLAVGVLLLAMDPLPEDYEQWSCCGGEPGVLMVARGPAVARYDAATDTTIAVFQCAHHYCRTATQIAGNATAQVAKAQTLLFSPDGMPAEGEVDLSRPIAVPEGLSPAGNVTTMTGARFEVGRAWLPLLLYQLAFLGVVLGALLAIGAGDEATLLGVIGAAVGVFAGAQLAAAGAMKYTILPTVFLILAVGGGLAAFVARKRWPRASWATAFLLGVAAALVFSMLVADRFFVHAPMD